MKNLFILIAMLSLSACMTEKRAERRMIHLSVGHPSVSAKLCANYIKESHTSTIEYRQGERDTIWQSEYVDCDTVIGTDRIVKVPYPVIRPIHDTLIFRDSIFMENTKKTEVIQAKLNNTEYKLIQAEKQANVLSWVLGIIVAIYAVFLLIKRFL